MRAIRRAALLLALLGGASACRGPSESNVVRVYAASSLTLAFEELADAFEAQHEDLHVEFNFAGSQVLRLQIEHGARADVLVSAHLDHVEALAAEGLLGAVHPYVNNALALVVPRANPAGIETFWQLTRARTIVVGTPEVPIGAYTEAILTDAAKARGPHFRQAVERHIVSREPNVRLVLAKVELGEADAAFVYGSDAASSRRVRAIPMPPELDRTAEYFVASVLRPSDRPAAAAFIAFARSPAGLSILERHGFRGASP